MNQKYVMNMMEIASDFDAISTELFALSHNAADNPQYDPKTKLYSLVRSTEENAVQLRHLAGRVLGKSSEPIYDTVVSAMGIGVVEEEKWLKITVPAILPSRNQRDNLAYITRPLRHCLIQFQRENPMERFRNCGICIVHMYDESLGIRRVRDYDNIETKRYLDVIESILLTNDSGLLCSVLQTTKMGERDCTQFYLMQPEALSIWAKDHIKSNT